MKDRNLKPRIEILGPESSESHTLLSLVKEAVSYLRIEADIKRSTERDKFEDEKVRDFPALVIDGEIKTEGFVPEKREIVSLITTAIMEND